MTPNPKKNSRNPFSARKIRRKAENEARKNSTKKAHGVVGKENSKITPKATFSKATAFHQNMKRKKRNQ